MNRRTRTLAGVVTLSALTFSFAETVYASMCQMADMADMGEMANMGDMAGMRGMPGHMSEPSGAMGPEQSSDSGCPLTADHDARDERDKPDVPCPLTPAVGSGCSAVASFPAGQIAAVEWTGGTSASFASPAAGTDLLLTHGLFRPPRA